MDALKIICPNGHLGFAPLRTESFQLGVEAGRTLLRRIRAVTMSGRFRWAVSSTSLNQQHHGPPTHAASLAQASP